MAASFPSSVKSFTDKTDNIDDVMATDINSAYDEIEAIETELGTDPAGTFDTVVLRLDDIEGDVDDLEALIDQAVLAKNVEALTGAATLTDASDPIQSLDTNGAARDVTLPAEAATNPVFIIHNAGGDGDDLTVKDDSPATIASISDGEIKTFVSHGTSWYCYATTMADNISIADVGDIITATDVEGALQENRTALDLNTTHRTSNGTDHSYIDQDVTATADVTHDTLTLTGSSLLTGDVALDVQDGNIKVASGHGIDFSAHGNAAGMTSELLDDYEEGTWTVGNNSDSTGVISSGVGQYTKIGRLVILQAQVSIDTNFNANAFSGLPFIPRIESTINNMYGVYIVMSSYAGSLYAFIQDTSTTIYFKVGNYWGSTDHKPNTTDDYYILRLIYETDS